MLLGILEAGRPPEALQSAHGTFVDMMKRMLSAVSNDAFTFEVFPVVDGVVPTDASVCEGWLVTGSKHGAYDPLPWIAPTESLLREAVAKKIPVVGICFGHQLLAQALGGRVEKSQKGWGLGLHEYAVKTDVLYMKDSVALLATHQDQVVAVPASGEVLAGSSFCENAVIRYGNNALGFQGHPEFSREYLLDLMEARKPIYGPDAVKKAGESLSLKDSDSEIVARWIADFFLRRVGRGPPNTT